MGPSERLQKLPSRPIEASTCAILSLHVLIVSDASQSVEASCAQVESSGRPSARDEIIAPSYRMQLGFHVDSAQGQIDRSDYLADDLDACDADIWK